ncbi:MAG: methionine--tRNA ligase, partial [Candidatus Omnitrophica bacterium CG11_big_fil_rev_8_21_14_0_20_63_9]
MPKPVYLTTPLYYVNAAPHIGHSYTEVVADCLARYHRAKGAEVFLLTGTDEHGQKIEQAAAAAGKTPQAFVDDVVQHFQKLWQLLNIQYDDFIRTTQPRHVQAVQQILTTLRDRGALTHASYQGWYCTPDETFWTEAELHQAPGQAAPLCPQCQRPLEPVKEEGWHLPLRAHQPWLKAYVESHPDFVWPESRYNELKALLEQPLPEFLSITRPKHRVAWGIQVPFDPDHVVYVWVDALLNYITVPGYRGEDPPSESFTRLWPARCHIIGKDILRHHALYWPILLHVLGFADDQIPRIVTHGWWKVGEQKMSKSLGNIVNPLVVIREVLKGQPYAADIYRYFLLREVPFGQDGAFSEEALLGRLNADLANDLGNLVNRTLSMLERYCHGVIPAVATIGCAVEDEPLQRTALQLSRRVELATEQFAFSNALEAVMQLVSQANQYVEAVTPWKLAKQPDQAKRLQMVLGALAEVVRIVAIVLEPFMPSVSGAIWRQLGCGDRPRQLEDAARWGALPVGQRIGEHPVLFPK